MNRKLNFSLPRPKSFLKLILLGFAFVVLPLLVALGLAAWYADQMADQSQRAVYQAAVATQSSRMLVEQVTVMERAARQYQVLGDVALFKAYREAHDKFQQTVATLLTFPLEETVRFQLTQLNSIESRILRVMENNPYNSEKSKAEIAGFEQLASGSREILNGSQTVIDREVQEMYDLAGKAQKLIFWFGLTVIPAVVLIVLGFTILISRPIAQIDQAIRKLGDGELSTPIQVAGPQDLESLGERLNWLRQRLAEVEEEKVKFLRHVSHELKTPLTALREGTDLLADGLVGQLKPQQKEVVQILGSNTAQLQHLIEDLLNFSVAHLKKPDLHQDRVPLDKLMRRVIADQKLAIMSKQLRLNVRFDPVSIRGDKEKLRVVFDNLLSNAVKFSPRQGKVEIAVRKLENSVAVDIRDAGPGIHSWEKERVFEAFYQGESVAEGHIKGTGLGLSIARDYVQAHGGQIAVNEKNIKGAHVSLRLPLDVAQGAA
ncbi:MAG: HAMP domain-containing histidine kinase [Gammaproteobacteria bacterium]|nr:HAMP domain-containing histidine kinase [Gammaproteobacteria bacterium]MDH5801176.1 HAMP domain-containing histidine kinase [Gammaproteobacteria bacterium]